MACFCKVTEDAWVWVQGLLVLMSMIEKKYENNNNIANSLEPILLKSAVLYMLPLMNGGNNNGKHPYAYAWLNCKDKFLNVLISCYSLLWLMLKVIGLAIPNLKAGNWFNKVNLWRVDGLFKCLPIFSFAFGCQTYVSLFTHVIYVFEIFFECGIVKQQSL